MLRETQFILRCLKTIHTNNLKIVIKLNFMKHATMVHLYDWYPRHYIYVKMIK